MATVVGQQLKKPALIHKLFKKQDLVEFVLHEASIVSQSLIQAVASSAHHWTSGRASQQHPLGSRV